MNQILQERVAEINEALDAPLDMRRTKTIDQGAKGKLTYITWNNVAEEANVVFGPLDWSYRATEWMDLEVEEVPEYVLVKEGDKQVRKQQGYKYRAFVGCNVRLEIHPGGLQQGIYCFREELGYGDQYGNFARSRFDAISQARYIALSTGLKRAFRTLGNRFGLALYTKENERGERVLSADEAAAQELAEAAELNAAAQQLVAAAVTEKKAQVSTPSPTVTKAPTPEAAEVLPDSPPISEPVKKLDPVDAEKLNAVFESPRINLTEHKATIELLANLLADNPLTADESEIPTLVKPVQTIAALYHDFTKLRSIWKAVLGREAKDGPPPTRRQTLHFLYQALIKE